MDEKIATADEEISVLLKAVANAARGLRCCPMMTLNVPKDSVEARVPYCPNHGRHSVSKADWEILQALEVLDSKRGFVPE